jgi:hypothetical protein
MESITKNRQPAQVLRAMVARAYGPGQVPADGEDYFFMAFIDADNLGITGPALPPADRDAYHEAIGAANRELNAIRGPAFGPLAGPGGPSWRAVFTGMAEDVLRDGERRQVGLGWDYDAVRWRAWPDRCRPGPRSRQVQPLPGQAGTAARALTSCVVRGLPAIPQSPLRTSSTTTQVTGRMASPSIATIASVSSETIRRFCSGVNTSSISLTLMNGITSPSLVLRCTVLR